MKENSFPKDKTIYLIDGLSVIFRSFHAFKGKPLTNAEGANVNAFIGFFKTLFSIFKQHQPQYLAIILDSKEISFRKEMYEEYKATRAAPPSELVPQIDWIKETLKAMKIPTFEMARYEADDLMASLAKKASQEEWFTYILSPDKDLLQMVDERTHVLKLEKNNFTILDIEAVKEQKGVWPKQIRDFLALIGDSSDNVPGVRGIGEKSAIKLLENYENLEDIYQNLDKIKPALLKARLEKGKEEAFFSFSLVKLETNLNIINSWNELKCSAPSQEAEVFFRQHNATTLIKTLRSLCPETLPLFSQDSFLTYENIPTSSHLRGTYNAITQEEELKNLLEEALKAPYVVLDTETTGLETMETELLGIALSYRSGEGFYIPLRTKEGNFLSLEIVRGHFNKFFKNSPKIVGHNLKFDWQVFLSHGFNTPTAYADTMLMAWLIDSTSSYKMDFLAQKYLDNYTTISFKDIVEKGKNFSTVDLKTATEYSSEDADITLRLFETLMPMIQKENLESLLFELEMPLMEVLNIMEIKGILLDKEQIKKSKESLKSKENELEKEIFNLAGEEFNILSPQQTQTILLKMNLMEENGKNNLSTSSQNLKKISQEHPILEKIIQYRSYKKLVNSYLNVLPDLIQKTTGRIHTSFFQPGTETGRLSSARPNLQNIPVKDEEGKAIREAFVAPKGYKLLSADYSQIELAVLAHLSQDPALCESFREGKDIHSQTAQKLFKVESANENQRRIAKTINFGVLYKMSAFRLSNELKIDFKEAKSFIDNYFETYKDISTFFENQIESVTKKGYSETILGHRRPLRGISSANYLERAEAERASINSIIQGSASDIVKLAMIKTQEALIPFKNKAHMLLQVHDELLFEIQEDIFEEVSQIVKREMEEAIQLIIPLKVNLKEGHSWGVMKEL